MIEVSIVIPVRNEAENINALAEEISTVMNRHPWSWECIWVDDSSQDESLAIIRRVAEVDHNHRYLSFERHAGQSAAFWAGFQRAKGSVLATLDGDGQNDPEDIPPLVSMVLTGEADMANGRREKRRDSLMRRTASHIANGFRNITTGKTVRDVGCSTRAFKRACVDNIPPFAGMHRFLPTFAAMQGFRIAELAVRHRPRVHGRSKYTIHNRLWVGLLDVFGVWWLRKRAFHYKITYES
jgi:dolichol-phosphate mannosyltransferase